MGSYSKSKGRSDKERYVGLPYYMLNSEAYKSLNPNAVCIYIELKRRFHGANNGYIGLSVREASEVINSSINTACKYLNELMDRGFIKRNKVGEFRVKNRQSTEYILTEYAWNNQRATKEFMKWRIKN
jgi:predicted transcriptional regulator of viral defense system